MNQLTELRAVACRIPRAQFQRSHAGLYVLAELEEQDNTGEFRTAARPNPLKQMEGLEHETASLMANKVLFPVQKSSRNPWKSQITLGRAHNNDLVIRHESVSKLHAFFLYEDGIPTELVDAGSSNGTVLNGKRLDPDQPVPVASGSHLSLGEVYCEVLDAGELYDVIRALYPTVEILGST